MRLGRVGRLAAVAGVFLLADPWLTVRAAAQASDAQVVSPGEAVELPQGLSFNLPPLTDGRVNSYGVAGEVTGVGFGTATDIPGGPNYQAAPGDQLLMFGLQLSSYMVLANDTIDSTIDPTSSTTVKVTTGSQTINLPQVTVQSLTSPGGTTGDELATQYYALSVAPGAPAILSVSCGGITQELNLRTGKRVGISPQALYRDPTPAGGRHQPLRHQNPEPDRSAGRGGDRPVRRGDRDPQLLGAARHHRCSPPRRGLSRCHLR